MILKLLPIVGALVLGNPLALAGRQLAANDVSNLDELPSDVMEPSETPPSNSPAPRPKSDAPEPAPEPAPKAESTNPAEPPPLKSTDEQILESPTRSVDDYERLRKERYYRRTLPDYAFDVIVEPRAFGNADLRAPTHGGFDQTNPHLFGVLFGYQHTLLKRSGLVMAGVDGGLFGSTVGSPYSKLALGFQTLAPHLLYEGVFVHHQWVVPTAQLDLDFVRYSYTFQNQAISGFRTMPRVSLGIMIFLNLLEPTAAGEMQADFNIHRTYLTGFYTIAADSSKQDFNLGENTFRIGLRFEH